MDGPDHEVEEGFWTQVDGARECHLPSYFSWLPLMLMGLRKERGQVRTKGGRGGA